MYLTFLLLLVSTTFILLFYFVKKKYSYWKDRGIPYLKPIFPFGNFKGVGSKQHIVLFTNECYKKFKSKSSQFGGLYMMLEPVVLVTDLNLVKNILVKDFNYFTDHGLYMNEKDDPFSAHLFALPNERWKKLRHKLSPTLTAGKMKMMFPTMSAVADQLKICVDSSLESSNVLGIWDVSGKFTTDIIGCCTFGINCNSLNDPKNEFLKMGVFALSKNSGFEFVFKQSFGDLARKLKIKFWPQEVIDFYMEIVKDTVDYREKNNVKRNDVMDLLIQLKNEGKLDGDELGFLTISEIAVVVFFFFIAGFESTASTITFALFELTQNMGIQKRLREEILYVLEEYDGKVTYESISKMSYLDLIVFESLRKYPTLGNLMRIAVADYKVPGTDAIIKKGQQIVISPYAIQNDPDYYENPEVFDPDRFLPEEVKKRNQFAYLPFGEGPRICIGQRFGILQVKLGLITMVSNYNFELSEKTVLPVQYELHHTQSLMKPQDDIYLKVEKIRW